MKKIITIFFILFFFKPIFGFAYPKSLNAILPADALYQPDLSKAKTTQADEFLKRIQGKFYRGKTIYHIFLTNSPFQVTVQQLKTKGIQLKLLQKQEKLAELEKQNSAGIRPLINQLKDPHYQEATGTYQNWLIQIFSSTTLAGKKINQTTIVFTKSVEVKEETDKMPTPVKKPAGSF